jgi:hypothetical protein
MHKIFGGNICGFIKIFVFHVFGKFEESVRKFSLESFFTKQLLKPIIIGRSPFDFFGYFVF